MYSAGQCLILCRGIGLAWCGQCVSRHRAAFFTFHSSLFTLITQCGALALAARSDGTCSALRRASQRTAFLQELSCVILCAVLLGVCQCSVRPFSLGQEACFLAVVCSWHGGWMAFATQLHGSLTSLCGYDEETSTAITVSADRLGHAGGGAGHAGSYGCATPSPYPFRGARVPASSCR